MTKKKERVRIGVLRHKVTKEERAEIKAAYPDKIIEFVRLDPTSSDTHDELCLKHNLMLVYLPSNDPIPTKAMKRGVVHITVVPGRGLCKLLPLVPQFEEFVPER